ncbi:Lysine-specific demethylase 8 [Thelohanellus kitauei]|uniref:Lysine-specific demethylase 8 n=1 Tax=Thelohanellus kitauei TaxID=669202 RepID=A0A0C2IZI4_THEKT|nr:Lysine-specific demethylase 8 [Thelohanellus kitauei]
MSCFTLPKFQDNLSDFFRFNDVPDLAQPCKFIEKCFEELVKLVNIGKINETNEMIFVMKRYVWEMIYSKHFSEVDQGWFLLHSLIYFLLAYKSEASNDWAQSLKYADKAVIIGGSIYDDLLLLFIKYVTTKYHTSLQEIASKGIASLKSLQSKYIPCPLKLNYPIEIERKNLTLSEFQANYYQKLPIILMNGMKDWPAMSNNRWSLDYFLR